MKEKMVKRVIDQDKRYCVDSVQTSILKTKEQKVAEIKKINARKLVAWGKDIDDLNSKVL